MQKQTLAGHSIIFTGETHLISRANARNLVQDAGGTIQGDFSTETTLLVLGGPAHVSQRKLNRARLLGVRIISEAEFVALLNGK